jgi:superfamily II DNA or RNA helicase
VSALHLKPFQRACVDVLRHDFACWHGADRRAAAVLPTGAGKTVIASQLLVELCGAQALRAVVFTSQLMAQHWLRHLQESAAPARRRTNRAVTISPQVNRWTAEEQIVVASVFQPHLPWFSEQTFPLLVFDECHHAQAQTWRVWFERAPNAYKLGLTATPLRGDGICVTEFFDRILYLLDLRELIASGDLVDARGWRVNTQTDLSTVPVLAGEYEPSALGRKVNTPGP